MGICAGRSVVRRRSGGGNPEDEDDQLTNLPSDFVRIIAYRTDRNTIVTYRNELAIDTCTQVSALAIVSYVACALFQQVVEQISSKSAAGFVLAVEDCYLSEGDPRPHASAYPSRRIRISKSIFPLFGPVLIYVFRSIENQLARCRIIEQ